MPNFPKNLAFGLMSYMALITNSHAQSSTPSFYWQTYQPETDSKLYEHCGEICPDIDYRLIDTDNVWLDTTINKAVINSLSGITEDNPQAKARYDKFNALAVITQAEAVKQLNTTIASLIADNEEIVKIRGKDWYKGNDAPIQSTAKPIYLGHKTLANNSLELMELETYSYSGGAHGVGGETFYVFDMANKCQLTLDDILLPNQKANLEKAVKAKFIEWIKKVADQDPAEYQKMWAFDLTDNFTFTKDGLKFVYQPYEISPYAMGMPEFTVKYGELNGIVKADYLH